MSELPMMMPDKFTASHGELAITTYYKDRDGNDVKRPLTTVQDRTVVLQLEQNGEEFYLVLGAASAIQIGQTLMNEANDAIAEFEDDQERMEVDITVTISDPEAFLNKDKEH